MGGSIGQEVGVKGSQPAKPLISGGGVGRTDFALERC
jgi:hypothetical protein